MPKGYQYLTYEQRCQIFALLKRRISQSQIALILGVTQSTISREIQRNCGKRGYRFKQAHTKALDRRIASGAHIKFTPEIQVFVEYLLVERQWSPEQIDGSMARMCGGVTISHERIYRHIWHNKRNGGKLYQHLRRRGKKYNKRGSKLAGRGLIPNRVGIEFRPAIVDQRKRIGDLEVDTIIGAQHRGAILSIVDRKSKLTLLELLSSSYCRTYKQSYDCQS